MRKILATILWFAHAVEEEEINFQKFPIIEKFSKIFNSKSIYFWIDCDIITVDLKNDANEWQGVRKGTYKISETINGKPSWISNDQAIWWVPEDGVWLIGSLDVIGSRFGGLVGVPSDKNDLGMPYYQKYNWQYGNGNFFTTPGANDIKVQCKGNTYLDSKIVEFLISM